MVFQRGYTPLKLKGSGKAINLISIFCSFTIRDNLYGPLAQLVREQS